MKCICHHNKEVDCETPTCGTCGWNPAVTLKRLRKITSGQVKMAGDKKYRVPFTGYCEVYAQDEQEALDRADTIEQQFFAHYDYGNPICEEDEK
jgi:hypothetical protein